jgi:hypothetical protein
MQHGHGNTARTCTTNLYIIHFHDQVHVNVVCPYLQRMSMSLLHGCMSMSNLLVHVHAACPCLCPCLCPCCVSMSVLRVHVRAACPCPCCVSLSMLRVHVRAACPRQCCMLKSMQHGHGHAVKTRARSTDIDTQHAHGHAEWTFLEVLRYNSNVSSFFLGLFHFTLCFALIHCDVSLFCHVALQFGLFQFVSVQLTFGSRSKTKMYCFTKQTKT